MKKIIAIIPFMATSFGANAQSQFSPFTDKETYGEMFNTCSIILVIYIISVFILTIIRLLLDYRLKLIMIEKNVPEAVIAQLLAKTKNDKTIAIKWFAILTSIGIGLTGISFFQPLGIHSIVIMVFSISLGFLGYYFLLKRLNG